MPAGEHIIAQQQVPEALWSFLHDDCGVSARAFRALPGDQVPEPARRLLVHSRDMTSTLAAYHESLLRVEVLRCREGGGFYLREVFLRTLATGAIVEYGVIGIALDGFAPPQRDAIRAGQAPLGGLLHRFEIPFVSTPLGFFAVDGAQLAGTPLGTHAGQVCHGRFNRLARETGEPLAWILEILPAA